MKRYHITLGAGTTAGGEVITASSCCSINGIKVALDGDKIICPACKSQGSIKIFGSRIPESWNGKQVALQDRLELPERIIQGQTDAEGYSEPIAVVDRDRLMAWHIVD